MIRKYHNQTLQTKSQHREEESQNIYSNHTSVSNKSRVFLFKMVAELERTQSNAKRIQTQNPHKQWEVH